MKPSEVGFDFWSVVFLISAVQGIFVSLMLWQWKRGRKGSNRLLAGLLLMFSLTMLEYVLFWTHYMRYVPFFIDFTANWPFLMGPAVYLYLRSNYETAPLKKIDLWHAIPFALASTAYLPWTLLNPDLKNEVLLGARAFPVNKATLDTVIAARCLFLLLYGIFNFYYIRQQPRVQQTTKWALLVNGCFLGFGLAYISYFVLSRYPFFNTQWDYHISLAMSFFIWMIAWAGYVQPAVFDGYNLSEPEGPVKYKNSGLTAEASQTLLNALDLLMQEEKKYQDPEISLEKLAHALHSNKHHVSQIINAYKGVSFFEYINQLRIEEAKVLLAETTRQDLHIIEVAYTVGFNNKVSFNAAFKKITGMTPTDYRKNHGKSDGMEATPQAAG